MVNFLFTTESILLPLSGGGSTESNLLFDTTEENTTVYAIQENGDYIILETNNG